MSKQGTPFNAAAVSRITSATAKGNGGQIPAGSFAAKAQSTFAKSGGGAGKGSTGGKK
jgi:hypothetical protein